MNIPRSVKIGAHRFIIRWVRDLNNHGQCKHVDGEILMDESIRCNGPEALDTFLHESLHAMDYHAKLDLGEDTVHRLAFQLTAFLLENNLLSDKVLGKGGR